MIKFGIKDNYKEEIHILIDESSKNKAILHLEI